MNKQENNTNIKKYILLFLIIFLIIFGLWKCPNQPRENNKIELPKEKENGPISEESINPNVAPDDEYTPIEKKESTVTIKEEQPSLILESKEYKAPPSPQVEKKSLENQPKPEIINQT